MQIVIDIDENIYNLIARGEENRDFVYKSDLMHAIENGVPLPKGHGDLIDRKELLKQPMDKANYPSNYVQIAPTIIKADIESKENEIQS